MESARFFRLAERVAAYEGVMRARVMHEQEQAKKTPHRQTPARPRTPAEQRVALAEFGGDAVAVPSTQPSYLNKRLREANP